MRRVIKPALFVLCLLPLAVARLARVRARRRDLGANPIEKIQDTLGQWGLRFL